MEILYICLIGYFIGAIPFAYVIGKVFYNTDVRQHGSGNLGGSNTGRVLGKKAGFTVMALDVLKVVLVVAVATVLSEHPWAPACGGLAAGLGHCFPVYARFRGGKVVAALYGLLGGLWLCTEASIWVLLVPLAVFMGLLFLFKIVSLSSMVSAAVAVAYAALEGLPLITVAALGCFAVLIIWRHRSNIQRILNGTENKIRWL